MSKETEKVIQRVREAFPDKEIWFESYISKNSFGQNILIKINDCIISTIPEENLSELRAIFGERVINEIVQKIIDDINRYFGE